MITWKERVQALRDSGLTLAEIANHTGLAPSSIGDIATGRSAAPRGEAAILLHQLHEDRCKKTRSALSA